MTRTPGPARGLSVSRDAFTRALPLARPHGAMPSREEALLLPDRPFIRALALRTVADNVHSIVSPRPAARASGRSAAARGF